MFWYVSNEQDQVVMQKPLLENTAILLWETAGCKLGSIRGACASASLKRAGHLALSAFVPEYPRRMRLGLIEAASQVVRPGMCSRVSEAHAPRPH